MRRLITASLLATALVSPLAPAYAGPMAGTTTLLGSPTAGEPLLVEVTLAGAYPVVPGEFILENRCWFGGRFKGPVDSTETYPLAGPWFEGPGGSAVSSETVDLTPVPSGAVCRVSVTRGSSPVKGTTTSYAVG